MKTIYRLLLIILLILQGLSVSAQESPFAFGVEVGGNLSNTTYDLYDTSRGPKLGFRIGATVEYDISNGFYIQSGLALTTKGARHKGYEHWVGGPNPPITYITTTINQIYLQAPLMIAYKVGIAPDLKFFLNAGPHIACGIGGNNTIKEKTKGADTPDNTTKRSAFGSKGLKRFDFGLGGGVGIEFRQLVIGLNYELGLRDINNDKDLNSSLERINYKNRNASLTVGYRF